MANFPKLAAIHLANFAVSGRRPDFRQIVARRLVKRIRASLTCGWLALAYRATSQPSSIAVRRSPAMRCVNRLIVASLLLGALAWGERLLAGPDVGKPVPKLKVLDLTGPNSPNEVDYADHRKDAPTLYVFVQADKWDRPAARFLRTLDQQASKEDPNAYIVAVWLTSDVDKTKKYLPIAQQSLQLERTALTCFTDDKNGPKDWQIDLAASLSVVIAAKGKVAEVRDYRSINDTVVPEIRDALKKALKKP